MKGMKELSGEILMIGVCGGSASGKTKICQQIRDGLKQVVDTKHMEIVAMDSFYKQLTAEEREHAFREEYDFDHPNAIDFDMIKEGLMNLKNGKDMVIPDYDFVTHSRTDKISKLENWGIKVIIFEGIFTFYEKELRDMFKIKIYVDCDDDTRVIRRIRRDMKERGRSLESILQQYERFVKPSYDNFISQLKRYADVVVPFGFENDVAISIIVDTVTKYLPESIGKKAGHHMIG